MILLSSSKWLWHASALSLPGLDPKWHMYTYVNCKYFSFSPYSLKELLIYFRVISLSVSIRGQQTIAHRPNLPQRLFSCHLWSKHDLKFLSYYKNYKWKYRIKLNICSIQPIIENVHQSFIYINIFHYRSQMRLIILASHDDLDKDAYW